METAGGRRSARPRSCSAIRTSATTCSSTSTSTATTARVWARITRRAGRGWSRSCSSRAESEMRVNRKILRDHARSSRLEWLETNGAGGFAMGTVAGTNTRRYHGLLVASLRPPVDRHVLLSRLDEVISGGGVAEAALATNQYPGTRSPRGNEHLSELRREPIPTRQLELEPGKPAFVAASIGPGRFDAAGVADLAAAAREQRRSRSADPFQARLDLAADQFVVGRADGRSTVIAGYPWFTDWGRDTMISLPGLLLARGRLGEAREVLRGFLAHVDRGLIPNAFPDRPGDKPEYNTVDATLWMFQAVHAYVQASGDARFLREEFYPAAKGIVRWHRQGTHHGIKVDPADELLAAGTPGVQLTWMDARVGDRVITPRHGKPVEINALWYNALRLMALWGGALGDSGDSAEFAASADRVRSSFEKAFWNPQRGYLDDVVGDASLRPNQLFALSLPYPLLSPEQRKSVVRSVERNLLTPFGLRTLGPDEPGYVPQYRGGPEERDGAYHQGTIWPWLLGSYIRAYLCAFGRSPDTVQHCRDLLRPLEQHLDDACLGSISEVFSAESPFQPGGAPAQAWSVAELMQLLAVDLADNPHDKSRRERKTPPRGPEFRR